MSKNLIKNSISAIRRIALIFFFFLAYPQFAHAQAKEWGDCVVDGVPTLKCLEVVFGNILFLSNTFILLILFIMFVIGSYKYLTSLGSEDKVSSAKDTFKWAIIGLVLYLSAYLILTIIDIVFLGGQGKIFQFKIGE